MTSSIPLDEINKAISEINCCRAYDTDDMKSAKENWLSILNDAKDRYDTLEENDFLKINFVLCIHYLNYSNHMFTKEMVSSYGMIAKTLSAVADKAIDKAISDANVAAAENIDSNVDNVDNVDKMDENENSNKLNNETKDIIQ